MANESLEQQVAALLAQGETTATVREEVLQLYVSAGVDYNYQSNYQKAAKTFQAGIFHAQDFLTAGETSSEVREGVLWLYYNAGVNYREQGNHQKAAETYQAGISHAEEFLTAGETSSGVREQVLQLYLNADLNYTKQGNHQKAAETCQAGISHAEEFLTVGETSSGVRKRVLNLYSGAVWNYAKQGNHQKAAETYQAGISHAQDFLTAGETSSEVRELVLRLYVNAGVDYYKQSNHQKAAETWQAGISHAQDFLTAGETSSGVRERVLWLYDGQSSNYYNSNKINKVILFLPIEGIWSHTALAQVEPNHQQIILESWQRKLEISLKFPSFTTAFRYFLHTLALKWHRPKSPHRHFAFIPTATLLAITESLYVLAQVNNHQPLHTAYQSLHTLAQSESVAMVLAQRRQLAIYQQQLQNLKHGWLSRWHRWGLNRKIQRSKAEIEAANDNEAWQNAVKKTDNTLKIWLKTAIVRDLNTSFSVDNETGLKDLPDVALAMLLVSESLANDNPTAILTAWQTTPPWQSAATLRTAFAPSNWQHWVAEPKATLSKWIFALERNDTLRRLNIVWDVQNHAQPELQKWLRELSDSPEILPAQLAQAWETAQNQAELLAQHLIALAQPQATAYHGALTAVILGDVSAQLDAAITTWLQQQTRTADNELLTIYETRIYRFEQIAALIYEFPPASQEVLARDVHNWAQVYLTEILEGEATTEKIWEMLERARIGLNSLTLDLPENWEETLGEKLWQDLTTSIKWLAELIQHGKQPEPDSKWLPLETWLSTFAGWLSKLPTAAECQAILNPTAAIAQPFFDPNQQRLRVLWLDKYSLTLRELPDNCALKTDWDKIMQEWERGYQELRIGKSPDAIWEKVMQAAPVIHFAATLQEWATEFEQLSVIFPAPLGQLPWESLALLDDIETSFTKLSEKLVREASIAHWQSTQTAPSPQPSTWVAYNPAHHDKDCECTAAQWVAQQFNTQADTPSLFNALSGFANNRHIHLSTHAKFDSKEPIRSFLEINAGQNMPLWMLTTITTSAEFVMLCACESNLAGKATANLLTPIGIAPTIAAAGAKTVAGTLWEYNGVAALYFSILFYQIAQANPQMPWHKIAAKARMALKDMTIDEMSQYDLSLQANCRSQIEIRKAKSKGSKKPFKALSMYGGFVVLGQASEKT